MADEPIPVTSQPAGMPETSPPLENGITASPPSTDHSPVSEHVTTNPTGAPLQSATAEELAPKRWRSGTEGQDVPSVAASSASSAADKNKNSSEPKDLLREVAETVVFVVVLVLLLKTFIAEAFVIPTGSMATTLWGYQKYVKCPQCGHEFPVNSSEQSDPQNMRPEEVVGCVCPNCRLEIGFTPGVLDPSSNNGDRVLVFKGLYDSFLGAPHRHDVVVFKYPEKPQSNNTATNYIKRLIGLPNETIGIYRGKLYVSTKVDYPPEPDDKKLEWRNVGKMHSSDDWGTEAANFLQKDAVTPLDKDRKFSMIHKAPATSLAMRRLVFDNDCQPVDLVGKQPPRWGIVDAWTPDQPTDPRRFALPPNTPNLSWVRYHHIMRTSGRPELITDFMGYNAFITLGGHREPSQNWASDLMFECDVNVDKSGAQGELRLEISKGVDRFQARFDLATGTCTLWRIREKGEEPLILRGNDDKPIMGADGKPEIAKKPTPLKASGTYHVRLANFDERLTLWVDDQLPFGDGISYDPPDTLGPTERNDLEPVSVAAKDAGVVIDHLKVWRDTYYTTHASSFRQSDVSLAPEAWSDPTKWQPLRDQMHPVTMYVQLGHYLCLGDNSPASSDSRYWGLVPDRLMLGRALVVYFPFYPAGPTTRVGMIK